MNQQQPQAQTFINILERLLPIIVAILRELFGLNPEEDSKCIQDAADKLNKKS